MGKPASAAFPAEYFRLLHDRCGVEARNIPGCTPSPFLWDYAGGYDAVMVKAAKQKFGHDIFVECLREALRIKKAQKAREQ